MGYALLALRGPSNVEKKVRELQSSLYRQGGLVSALALPVMIPLCFVAPGAVPTKPAELRYCLRRAVGRQAPYLSSRAVAEGDGFLFWNLDPRRELQSLRRNCEKVFAPAATRQPAQKPDIFPVARGFFLCSLEGRSPDSIPSLSVSEPLRFPAKAAFLLHVRPLEVEAGRKEQDDSAEDSRRLWKSLFWEKLEEIPLRKTASSG